MGSQNCAHRCKSPRLPVIIPHLLVTRLSVWWLIRSLFFFRKRLVGTARASRVVSWLTLMTDTNLQPGDSVYILMDV